MTILTASFISKELLIEGMLGFLTQAAISESDRCAATVLCPEILSELIL